MVRSFGLVDYKIQEAEFFICELLRAAEELDFRALQFLASAYAAAARSVTFALQASLNEHPGFSDWYTPRQAALRDDPLARFFNDFRRITQHIGDNAVSGGSFRQGRAVYYFMPSADLPLVPDQDVVSACEEYFRTLLRLVYACYIDFGPIIDGQQRYTAEHFATLGKTIEDAEEELGFPRGYTDVGQTASEPCRWELLRRSADGCQIEEQFLAWLGLALPRPTPHPEATA